jgi:hypothetical protein
MKKNIVIVIMCVALVGCGGAGDKALEMLGSLIGGFASAFLSDLGGGGGSSSDRPVPEDGEDAYDDGVFIYKDRNHYKGTYEEDNADNQDLCGDALGQTIPSTITISSIDDDQLTAQFEDASQNFTLAEQSELDMYLYEYMGMQYGCMAGLGTRYVENDEKQDILVLYCQQLETEDSCNMLFVRDDE